MDNKRFAIGADIGGSHISCALVDMFKGHIVKASQTEKKINNKAEASEIIDGWKNALKSTIEKVGKENIVGVGFAMPGPFAYDKGVAMFDSSVDKFEKLYAINIAERLSEALKMEDFPFRFMNDASAFAVGEAWLGAASKDKKSVSITLGTGFGSAFITNGLPIVEGEGVPPMGRVWHLPFKDGIADDYFSTRWFINRWLELTGEKTSGVKPIADKAKKNDKAISLFNEFGSNLGNFLGSWLKEFDAEKLVIGGNVSGAYRLFAVSFKTVLDKIGVNTQIEISELKENAAIIGSARMLDPEYFINIRPVLSKM